jgi:hypothetical protein
VTQPDADTLKRVAICELARQRGGRDRARAPDGVVHLALKRIGVSIQLACDRDPARRGSDAENAPPVEHRHGRRDRQRRAAVEHRQLVDIERRRIVGHRSGAFSEAPHDQVRDVQQHARRRIHDHELRAAHVILTIAKPSAGTHRINPMTPPCINTPATQASNLLAARYRSLPTQRCRPTPRCSPRPAVSRSAPALPWRRCYLRSRPSWLWKTRLVGRLKVRRHLGSVPAGWLCKTQISQPSGGGPAKSDLGPWRGCRGGRGWGRGYVDGCGRRGQTGVRGQRGQRSGFGVSCAALPQGTASGRR